MTNPLAKRAGRKVACLAGLAAALGGGGARAQVIDDYLPAIGMPAGESPADTSRTAALSRFEAGGVRVGDVVIRPDLAESVGFNSNVDGRAGGRGSASVNTAGSLRAATDWKRDSAFVSFTVNDQRFLDVPEQSFTNWTAGLGGTLDVGSDKVGATYSHLNLNQTPGSLDAITVAQPVPFQVDTLRLSYTANTASRLSFIPAIDVTRFNYDDFSSGGSTFSQAYRNRAVFQPSLTTRYEVAPARALLFVLRGTHISYTDTPAGTPRRDSNGGAALAGFDYRVPGANLELRLLVGVQDRQYIESAYSSLLSPIVEASVTFTPTKLTTLTLLARRDIQEASDDSIGGFTYSSLRLQVDHELLRNVMLNGYAQIERAEFQAAKVNASLNGAGLLSEAGTSQNVYTAGASVTWLLNRNLRLGASFGISDRTGAASGGNYFASTGMLTLGLRL